MNNTVKVDRVGLGAAILLSAIAATGVASAQTMVQVQSAKDSASCVAAANALPASRVSVGLGYCQTSFPPAAAPSPAIATPTEAVATPPAAIATPQKVKVTDINQSSSQAQGSTTTVAPIKPL